MERRPYRTAGRGEILIVRFLAFRVLNILVLIVLSFDCVGVACERRNGDRIWITVDRGDRKPLADDSRRRPRRFPIG
jgi:hypothetical protein